MYAQLASTSLPPMTTRPLRSVWTATSNTAVLKIDLPTNIRYSCQNCLSITDGGCSRWQGM
jgi:hypothetical protein